MAITAGRGGAPGSYIYEGQAVPSQLGRASFNTTYMLVDAPEETSSLVFPFNRPIAINSLNEYENLIGTLPTVGGLALTSYYSVKGFFQQAAATDLRVLRVGTPAIIKEVAFDPSANKDNGVSAPSPLAKGDLVYIKLEINGIELGERTRNGAWLGVPVEVPTNYIAGDSDNNLAISRAMRDAVVRAIDENKDISAGAYIRETGEGDPSCDECSYLFMTGRIFNSTIEIIDSQAIVGSQNVLSAAGYTIDNISETERTVYDWIQAVSTGLNDPKAPQGYLCAPAAFSFYNQKDRINLGQTMEELASDAAHKWMAMIDCGPYYVTSIVDYKDYLEHSPADELRSDTQYLIENVIYKWTDEAQLQTSAKYEEGSAERSANSLLGDGDRRALKDNRFLSIRTAATTATGVMTADRDWPSNLLTGERVDVSLFDNGDNPPTAPTYSDEYNGVINADLVGTFYVIGRDVDSSLAADQIKLASSRTRALSNESIDIVTAGTPQGGGLLDMRYDNASWEMEVTINNKTSSLLEVDNSAGASFNTLHLPGTLQKPSESYDFKAVVRQLTNPSKTVGVGGNKLLYLSAANVDAANNQLKLAAHGFATRDKIYIQELPSATRFSLEAMGPITSVDFNNATQSSDDYKNGTHTDVTVYGGSGFGATATVTVTAGIVTDITITDGGENYQDADEILIKKQDIGKGTNGANSGSGFKCLVNGLAGATGNFPTLFVIKVDDNTIQLAGNELEADDGNAVAISDAGVDSTSVLDPRNASAQAVLTTGGDQLYFSADHGLKTSEKIYFDGDIQTSAATLVKGTDAEHSTLYYVKAEDRNFFRIAKTASNLSAGAYENFPTSPIVTASAVRFYRPLLNTVSGGTFSDAGIMRFIRGRKYQMDVNLATFLVKDEAGVAIENGTVNPYGDGYTYDLSTDFRLSASETPENINEYPVAAADINVDGTITIANHGYGQGQELAVAEGTGATMVSELSEDTVYYAIVVDANSIQLAETAALALAGTPITFGATGDDNDAGFEFVVSLNSTPFTFAYTEDSVARPLNAARDFAGENNFYCAPLSTGQQANAALLRVYGHSCLVIDSEVAVLHSSKTEIELVEPLADVSKSVWNFTAVTSGDLMSEALRGINNNGIAQAEVIETGMDNHNRLFAESQKYYTTLGFLAYYAPYVLNDVGVYVPPTPYVCGLAMRRYRDEIGGFRLPPAGAKYSLAGARGVQVEITTGMQDVSNPYGLNALRQLPGYSQVDPDTGEVYGPVFVWGGRTRINPENAAQALYKFVNTRVIMNVIYGTLDGALDGQIFNIIDGRAVVFNEIRTLISNILYSQFFVPGALFGSTANEAFEVVCDGRNNPAGNLENGLVNVTVFVVPVPTLERIEIDLIRVQIDGIKDAKVNLNLA